MPYSYGSFKEDVKHHLFLTLTENNSILDVGAGAGAYGQMLYHRFKNIDAIEIFPAYISEYNLRAIYRTVFLGNILTFDWRPYDYIIMGDVIEHLMVQQAQYLLAAMQKAGKKCLVAVPYLFEQGEEYGNMFEIHQQADLTPKIFINRYPGFKLLYGDEKYGYYVNY
jgi:cyclopropane fatty-acyl-phospholipid synthase-like methyltransferase